MSRAIILDNLLYERIVSVKAKLAERGCKNPSYSNAVRSMCDLPHISGKGRFDDCRESKPSANRRKKVLDEVESMELEG